MSPLTITADSGALRVAVRLSPTSPPITAEVPWEALTALLKRKPHPAPLALDR